MRDLLMKMSYFFKRKLGKLTLLEMTPEWF